MEKKKNNYVDDWTGLWIPRKVCGYGKLSWLQKCVLVYLVLRQGNNEYSYWSMPNMALHLGVSRITIFTATKDLEKLGYIEIKRIRIGRSFRNSYRVEKSIIELFFNADGPGSEYRFTV